MLAAFTHGLLLSLGLILPLGVQNVFVFTQGAIQTRWVRVLPVVITAALCDTILILLAVMGVSLIVLTFVWMKTALYTIGFFFLAYMGYLTWKGTPADPQSVQERFPPKKQIMFAASVSLFNPHAILDTIGVIGTSSLTYTGGTQWAFTLACIFLSWLWFLGLSLAGRLVGSLDGSNRLLFHVQRISAYLIWGIALYMGFTLVTSLTS